MPAIALPFLFPVGGDGTPGAKERALKFQAAVRSFDGP